MNQKGYRTTTVPSLGRAVTKGLLFGVGFRESEVLNFFNIKVSECYFHVKAVYGVTEDCFEIESRKSLSLFFFFYIYIY